MGEVNKLFPVKLLEIKDYIPLLLIFLYIIGYVYLKLYYLAFSIDFEYYISLVDIIFYSIEMILVFLLCVIFFELINLIFGFIFYSLKLEVQISRFKSSNRNKVSLGRFILNKRDSYRKQITIGVWAYVFAILFGVVLTIIVAYFSKEELNGFRFIYPLSSVGFFKLFWLSNKNPFPFERKLSRELVLAIIALSYILLTVDTAMKFSQRVKRGINTKELKFEIDGEVIGTFNKNLILIGETSNYIFIYNTKEDKSVIYSKSAINVIEMENDSGHQIYKTF